MELRKVKYVALILMIPLVMLMSWLDVLIFGRYSIWDYAIRGFIEYIMFFAGFYAAAYLIKLKWIDKAIT